MKIAKIFLVFKIGSSLQKQGNFFAEMEKFKNGLKERPQTYRKIEISEIESGSCTEECPNRKSVNTEDTHTVFTYITLNKDWKVNHPKDMWHQTQ